MFQFKYISNGAKIRAKTTSIITNTYRSNTYINGMNYDANNVTRLLFSLVLPLTLLGPVGVKESKIQLWPNLLQIEQYLFIFFSSTAPQKQQLIQFL